MMIKQLLGEPHPIERRLRVQLLLEVIQQTQSFLISHHDYLLTENEQQRYEAGLAALASGRPYAYVVGYQGFWKHDFLVNDHTLIPRPDTEILVETVLNVVKNNLSKDNQILRILDLGTGSGCIAISLAAELANAQVTAVDISSQALAIAHQNADRLGVTNVAFLQSHWFDCLTPQLFDIIVSNPPYIDPSDPHLAELTHEPITALTADNQGLADIEHIVSVGRGFLAPHGLLIVEHGYDQANQVQAIFSHSHFNKIQTVKDLGGNDRVTYGFK